MRMAFCNRIFSLSWKFPFMESCKWNPFERFKFFWNQNNLQLKWVSNYCFNNNLETELNWTLVGFETPIWHDLEKWTCLQTVSNLVSVLQLNFWVSTFLTVFGQPGRWRVTCKTNEKLIGLFFSILRVTHRRSGRSKICFDSLYQTFSYCFYQISLFSKLARWTKMKDLPKSCSLRRGSSLMPAILERSKGRAKPFNVSSVLL